MGNQHKRQYQQQKENALEESQTHGDALAVLGGSVMQNAAVLQGSKHEREKQKPHQQGRLHIAHKATEKPTDTLGAKQGARKTLRHRSCKKPRRQNKHHLPHSEQQRHPCHQLINPHLPSDCLRPECEVPKPSPLIGCINANTLVAVGEEFLNQLVLTLL